MLIKDTYTGYDNHKLLIRIPSQDLSLNRKDFCMEIKYLHSRLTASEEKKCSVRKNTYICNLPHFSSYK